MHKAILIFILGIFFVACNHQQVASETISFSETWSDTPVQFNLPKLDSLKKYNLFFTLRNTNDYPYSNLFLIAKMQFPQGKVVVDTLEYRMAAPDGTWLGEGIGSLKENKLWYKENVQFFETGIYTLSIGHALRNNGEVNGVTQLKGITEIGYIIEEVK